MNCALITDNWILGQCISSVSAALLTTALSSGLKNSILLYLVSHLLRLKSPPYSVYDHFMCELSEIGRMTEV